MPFRWDPREHLALGAYAVRWVLIAVPVAAAIGAACAVFLWALDVATRTREGHPWLLFLLPVAGVAIAALYHYLGKPAERGNNLIVEQIHEPSAGVPGRMAPMILVTTVITHLFGGSAGREGTAIQMGGSIASMMGRRFSLSKQTTRTLLMAGMAAGFGAVFGTPLTGAIFAMEVLAVGRISYEAIIPCLVAAVMADWTCGRILLPLGVSHTDYHFRIITPHLDWTILWKIAVSAVAFGLVAHLFSELAHGLGWIFRKTIKTPLLRPVAGAAIVIAMVYLLGTRDYIGLGVHPSPGGHVSITTAFLPDGADWLSWWWKVLLTAVTLSSGFKGGEVTPLFFIGATLGNVCAKLLHVPAGPGGIFPLFPAAGFVAVFAGATNTPLACTMMGIELFGGEQTIYLAVACFVAYFFSGHSGIYLSQRIATPKHPELAGGASLSHAREQKPGVRVYLRRLLGKPPAAHDR